MATHQAWRSSTQWQRLRKKVLERDGYRCTICGRSKQDGIHQLHVDHIVAVVNGGEKYDPDNCQSLCPKCHYRKSVKDRTRAEAVPPKRRGKHAPPLPVDTPGGYAEETAGQSGFSEATTSTPPPFASFRSGGSPADLEQAPRFFSDPHPNAVDSRFPELAIWGRDFLGIEWRPWQQMVLTRALEVDSDGRWCWPLVLVMVPRQQGKSVMVRGIGSWMASLGLLSLHVANRGLTAMEVWRPAAIKAEERSWNCTYARDNPVMYHPSGGRYMCQAANDRAGVGMTVDGALLDEVWDIRRHVWDQALSPAMSAVDNPFALWTSTAGDSDSDLLSHYREIGLGGGTEVMLAEWSAPQGADWQDREVWRQTTPFYDGRRERFMEQQAKVLAESTFRSQYLNQWVGAIGGWMPASAWERGASKITLRHTEVAAVEVNLDGDRHYLVRASRDEKGQVLVEMEVLHTFREVDLRLRELRPGKVLASPSYISRLGTTFETRGSRELDVSMRVTMDLVKRGALRHPGDQRLTDQVLAVRAHVHKSGAQSLMSGDGRGLSAVRALLWAVSEAAAVTAARPRFRVAR